MKKKVLILSVVLTVFLFTTSKAQLGFWPLDNNANDASGNAINGTLTGSPTFGNSIKMQGTHSLILNGSSQYVDLGNPSSFPAGSASVTLSAWARTNSTSGSHTIIGFGSQSTGQGIFIGSNGAKLAGGGYLDNLEVLSFWALNVWHHIALTYDGTTVKIYADGVQVTSAAKTLNVVLLKAFIGRNVNSSNYWNGYIDDVKIFNSALTAAQVLSLASTTAPVVPTGLTATTASSTSINLGWTDASNNEFEFLVERSTTSGSGYVQIAKAPANTTTYTDATVSASTTYYYRIRSSNANGVSSYTSVVSATTMSAIPVVPTGLTATATSPTSVNLAWTDASTNETGFQIERSLTTGTGFSLVTTTASNIISYSDTNLTGNTIYYYRIRSVNASGGSAYTTEITVTTPPAVPNPPTGLIATSVSPTTINLTWTDASNNETGFQIVRSLQTGTGFSLIATTSAGVVSYSDASLTFGTTYFYKVRAINAAGNSSLTGEASATTPQNTLTAPSNLVASAVSATSVNLSWTDLSSNETGFKIERSLTETGTFSVVATTSPNATANADIGLTPGTTYFYRIRATSSQGNCNYSAIVSATTPQPLPAAPSGLSAAVGSPTSATLTWRDNASNETEVEIERSLTFGSGYALITTVQPNIISYSDTSLVSGNTYYYRIRSVNGGGASDYTNEATVRLPIAGANAQCENIFCGENGSVGIGTQIIPAGYTLAVNGKVMAEGVKVALQTEWPDYVFENGYELKEIADLKKFIDANGHLPNVPSSATVEKEGIDLGEINTVLVEKIEELSLYLIQMEERIKLLETENIELKKKKNKSKR